MANEKKVTLQKCLDGTTDYDHAHRIKELYEKLNSMGNNTEWQLYVLHVITEGVKEKRKAERNIPWPSSNKEE